MVFYKNSAKSTILEENRVYMMKKGATIRLQLQQLQQLPGVILGGITLKKQYFISPRPSLCLFYIIISIIRQSALSCK
jgi:hypothetical protein